MGKFTQYQRIVVYQPRSAWVCDLGPGKCLSPRFDVSENRFDTAAGTKKAIARFRRLVIPVFDEDTLKHLEVMRKEGCEIRAIAIGGGSHIVWELDSAINLVPFGGSPGQITGANLELETDIFEGSIYQSSDLLSGVPWACEDATLDGGTYYLPGPTGYTGNRWVMASGQSVDEDGTLTGSGTPQLTMHFPLQGATVQLKGAWIGSMKTLDHSGATLSTTNKLTNGSLPTATIDDGTWNIQFDVTTASSAPELHVTDAGDLESNRTGDCIDCSDPTTTGTTPGWST